MSSSVDKPSLGQSLLKSQNVIYGGIAWSVGAILFFLLFSIKAPDEEFPTWYKIGTYVFEAGAFLIATLFCWRNWRSPQIASGRMVWLGIGLGMLTYFIGDLVYGWWELIWGLEPDVSPADFCFVMSYLLIGWGMFLAVLPRRLNLEKWQWVTVASIAVLGIAIAVWVTISTSSDVEVAKAATVYAANVPDWVKSMDKTLGQLLRFFTMFYVIGDIILLITAATLLMAFWGGKFSLSWRMLAVATFFLYIADMSVKVAAALPQQYESGGLLEVCFVLSAVCFTIGSILEYDVSSRPVRSRRKRGAASS